MFKKEEELIRYSYHVAGTVGIMMCDALKCNNDLAKSFAIDLGIAIPRSIANDLARSLLHFKASHIIIPTVPAT